MHNIDRTVGEANYEYNNESYELNPESYEYQGEMETGEDEFLHELNGTHGEAGYHGETMGEYAHEGNYETYEMNNEAMEMELATELLGVTHEAELEQFLGKLIRRAAGAVKNFANSSAGKALGGILKAAAKKALPIVGGAAGTFFGGPMGGMIGSKLGSYASNLFELELEGLSNEDKEFELSRAYVRFANNAVKQAIRNPRFRSNPQQAIRSAVVTSAKKWAPGLLRKRRAFTQPHARPMVSSNNQYNDYSGYDTSFDGNAANGNNTSSGNGNSYTAPQQGSGTWYKQGNQIILNL